MIQNITKTSTPRETLNYVHTPDSAERIAGNLAGRTPEEMEREWKTFTVKNDRVEKDVWHASLTLPEGESLTNTQWKNAAKEYVGRMGFALSAWVAYRHHETSHDHIHIVACRIDFEGRAVDVWKDYTRGQVVCRNLERRYDLRRVLSSWEVERTAPSRNEHKMMQRTGQPSVRVDIQDRVEEAAANEDTFSEYITHLTENGIRVELCHDDNETPNGLLYVRVHDGAKMKASDIGRAYTLHGLQKYCGIHFSSDSPNSFTVNHPPSHSTLQIDIPTHVREAFDAEDCLRGFIHRLYSKRIGLNLRYDSNYEPAEINYVRLYDAKTLPGSAISPEYTWRGLQDIPGDSAMPGDYRPTGRLSAIDDYSPPYRTLSDKWSSTPPRDFTSVDNER